MIKFGLSFYGLTCFSLPELLILIDFCRRNKITFLRVWLTWWGNPEQDAHTIVNPNFSINYDMLGKLKWFMEKAPDIHLYLTYLRNDNQAFPYTARSIAAELSGGNISYDVGNEMFAGFTGVGLSAKASQEIRKEDANAPISVSSAGQINAQLAAWTQYHGKGGVVNMLPSHVDRNDQRWGYNTEGWFKEIDRKVYDAARTHVDMWDDEGARVGDENAGGGPRDPTLEQWKANFVGAKRAGCKVTVMHTAAFFNRENVKLWTPTENVVVTSAKRWLEL